MSADISVDTIRILLHILGVTVWLGGQIVLLALLPVLRNADVDGLPAQAAQAFQRVAWPAFALTFVTGIWNIFEVDLENATTGYNVVFGIKFLLVVISGLAAWIHSHTNNAGLRGLTGALGLVAALGAFLLGYAMAH